MKKLPLILLLYICCLFQVLPAAGQAVNPGEEPVISTETEAFDSEYDTEDAVRVTVTVETIEQAAVTELPGELIHRPDERSVSAEFKTGGVISFGRFVPAGESGPKPLEWRIAGGDSKRELISKNALIEVEYDDSDREQMESALLEWLNTAFLNQAFSGEELSCLCVKHECNDNEYEEKYRDSYAVPVYCDGNSKYSLPVQWRLKYSPSAGIIPADTDGAVENVTADTRHVPVRLKICLDLDKYAEPGSIFPYTTDIPEQAPGTTAEPTQPATSFEPAPTQIPPTPPTPTNWILWVVLGVLLCALGAAVGILLKRNLAARKQQKKRKRVTKIPGRTVNGYVMNPSDRKDDVRATAVSYRCADVIGQGKRDYQEDALWYSAASSTGHPICAVIADGMGGMDNGAESSLLAIETIKSYIFQICPDKAIYQQLSEISKAANNAVYNNNSSKDMNGGSTLVMVFINNNNLYWLSIGDSRIYLYRDGMLAAVNEEHELENRMYNGFLKGEIDLQDIREMQDRELRKLTSNLGRRTIPLIDQNFLPYRLHKGDKLLLCSDGVSGTLKDSELLNCLNDANPGTCCQKIAAAVEAKGKKGQDNYSAIVVSIETEDGK